MTTVARAALDAPEVPCRVLGPDLWFAEHSDDVEKAKALCLECPIRAECLAAALDRQEPWGVWGGEVFVKGQPVDRKRGRGRPRVREVARHEVASREVASREVASREDCEPCVA